MRSQPLCDELYVSIGVNPNKKALFTLEKRLSLIKEEPNIKWSKDNWIKVSSFEGLLVNYAQKIGASILIRGIRSVSDFKYEINLANVNKILAPQIETVFLPTSPKLAVVSSSMVKEIAKHGGDISKFVPVHVAKELKSVFASD